jgi:hypothetical protein
LPKPVLKQQAQVIGLRASCDEHVARHTPPHTSPSQVHFPSSQMPLAHCAPHVQSSNQFRPWHTFNPQLFEQQ